MTIVFDVAMASPHTELLDFLNRAVATVVLHSMAKQCARLGFE